MATNNTELSFRLTGDPASLLASLAQSRAAMLRTYGTMKDGVETAKTAWAEAQARVKGLADSIGSMGPPTKAQVAELARVRAEAGKLKDAYLAARDAAQTQQGRLRDNASQASAAQQAVQAAEAQRRALATAEVATRAAAARRAEAMEEQRLAAIMAATRTRVFPTDVGMNRPPPQPVLFAKRVPHGCGDEPLM